MKKQSKKDIIDIYKKIEKLYEDSLEVYVYLSGILPKNNNLVNKAKKESNRIWELKDNLKNEFYNDLKE